MSSETAVKLFQTYVAWLKQHAPLSYANLNSGASAAEISALEDTIGQTLPDDLKAVLAIHNGEKQSLTPTSDAPKAAVPTIPGLAFLSTQAIAFEWQAWQEVLAEDPSVNDDVGDTYPCATDKVKAIAISAGWIPLWCYPMQADYIGMDLDPDTEGQRGQIINFGRDESTHFVCAQSFTELLSILVEEINTGAWGASEIPYDEDDGSETSMPWLDALTDGDNLFNKLAQRAEQATALRQ